MDDAIERSHLRLRPFRSDHVRFAFDWFGDPLVMRFSELRSGRSSEMRDCCSWQTMDGLTSDIVSLSLSGAKGLATEAASACVQKAFGDLKRNRLVAIVHPENHASIYKGAAEIRLSGGAPGRNHGHELGRLFSHPGNSGKSSSLRLALIGDPTAHQSGRRVHAAIVPRTRARTHRHTQ